MSRLLLGVLLASFLAFIGVQSVHSHAAKTADGCSVCALGQQAQRHAPAAAPAVQTASEAGAVVLAAVVLPDQAAPAALRSRGPPAFS